MMIDDSLTVAVDGHLERTTKPALEALDTLWQTVRELPIGEYQDRYMHRLLGSGSTLAVEQLLDADDVAELPLDLGDAGTTTIRIWRGDGRTRAQRAVDRYEVEELPPGPRRGRSWAVRDTETGTLVQDDEGTTRTFPMESSAHEWIKRQSYIAGYRGLPGRELAR
jgi:hypothetical protein